MNVSTWAVVKKTDKHHEPLFTVKNRRIAKTALELMDIEPKSDYEVVRLPDL